MVYILTNSSRDSQVGIHHLEVDGSRLEGSRGMLVFTEAALSSCVECTL